jgi:hypothetical protein
LLHATPVSNPDEIPNLSLCSLLIPSVHTTVSSSKISRSEDVEMDRAIPKSDNSRAGISIRNGPVDEMDVDSSINGAAKRKSRGSLPQINYKDGSDSEGEPLVSADLPNFGIAAQD